MNAIVSRFVDLLRERNHFPDMGRDFVRWDDLTLRVHRSLDDEFAHRYELIWPSLSDSSIGIYPLLLCECALGHDFHYAGFTQRAASFVHLGSPYSEEWNGWQINAHTEGSYLLLQLTPPSHDQPCSSD